MQKPIIKKIHSDRVLDLVEKLKKLDAAEVSLSGCIVFKTSSALRDHLLSDPEDCEQILQRSNGAEVRIITCDENDHFYGLYAVTSTNLSKINDGSKICEIRQFDLEEVLTSPESTCFHYAPEKFHFRTPSGIHTKYFLRLADAINSYNALDRVSFWLRDLISKSDAVLVDNWSLASIVIRTLMLVSSDAPFDCLNQHFSKEPGEAKRQIRKLVVGLPAGSVVLVVVSVVSSGNFIDVLRKAFEEECPGYKIKFVTIFMLSGVERVVDTLCKVPISEDTVFYDEENCEYCAQDESVIDIDPRSYYPKATIEKKVGLPMRHLNRKKDIVRLSLDELSVVPDVLSVHRTDPNDRDKSRHHAYYVDIAKLSTDITFKDRFLEVYGQLIDEQGIPDLIVAPPHQAADEMLKILNEKHEISCIQSHDLRDLTSEQLETLHQSVHICILDDVLISGRRLMIFNRFFREELGENNLSKISYLHGLYRTDTKEKVADVQNNLSHGHDAWRVRFFNVYQLYLPNWGMDACPWCAEERFLNEVDKPFEPDETFASRLECLQPPHDSGIVSRPLLRFRKVPDLTAGDQSPIITKDIPEMGVVFSTAVLLQLTRLDENPNLRLERQMFNNNSLNGSCEEQNGCFQRYSEPLFQACLLRNVRPKEWSSDMVDKGLNRLIRDLSDPSCDILLGEIVLFSLRMGTFAGVDRSLLDFVESHFDQNSVVRNLLSEMSTKH